VPRPGYARTSQLSYRTGGSSGSAPDEPQGSIAAGQLLEAVAEQREEAAGPLPQVDVPRVANDGLPDEAR